MNRDHFVVFEIASKYCISDSFVGYDGYSISELNSPIPVHFSSLIPKMSTFMLVISCLTTSNLPWLRAQHSRSYAVFLFITSELASITSHTHNWVLFLLWLHLFILSGVIFPLISSSMGTYRPGELSFSVLSFYLFILFMGFSRQEYWRGFPFPSLVTTFCQNPPPWPVCLAWPYIAWLVVSLS